MYRPDLDKHGLTLYNQKGAIVSNSIVFRVEKCIDGPDEPAICKSEKEKIENFVEDLSI